MESPNLQVAAAVAEGQRNDLPSPDPRFIEVENFNFWYGEKQVLFDLQMDIPQNKVTAFIGPSGCGKSTLLRNFNRLNELIDGTRQEGDIRIGGQSIFAETVDVISLRKRVGMVFQKYNPFPKSIYENVIYSKRIAGVNKKSTLDQVVEQSLQRAAIWDEVKDRLHESALGLSGGQMQRLCIARAIANEPPVLLMDEPCSALDPIASGKIEELIHQLKVHYTIVIVTHNMQQAARVSDRTAFFYLGKLIEYDATENIFLHPQNPQTEAYVSGSIG